MAYVAILLLLIIVLALGFTFLLKASTEASATLSHIEGIQAEYLAEAAANKAVWRLLYDPTIPTYADAVTADTYEMSNLSAGRYGYNFRPHTTTTFATVRAVGVAGDAVVREGWVLNLKYLPFAGILAAYSVNGTNIPKARSFEDPSFGNAADTLNVGSSTHWLQLAGSMNKTEVVMATLDDGSDINVAVYDGATWGNNWEFTTSADRAHLGVDVAYESLSSDAMVAGRHSTGNDPYYSTWNGTSWSARTAISNPYGSGDVRTVVLASNPLSDELILGMLTSGNDLVTFIWSGSAWTNTYYVSASISVTQYHPFDICYEQTSGEALATYGVSSNDWIYANLGGTGTIRTLGNDAQIVRQASDPSSDYIIAAAVDQDNDLSVAVWNGSSWVYAAEIETNMKASTSFTVAVAWESSGDEALIFYGENGVNNLRYRRWTKSTGTPGSEQTGPSTGQNIESIQALTIPEEDRIIVLTGDTNDDCEFNLWEGDAFSADPPLTFTNSLYNTPRQSFDLAATVQY
ncbi:MAG: hypothetical protein HYV26_07630 [Candidatus Hydrogenedentes bacterium]|nr:hypothetical protein [Candidatus Hydrogenedentota bacterium]